MEQIFEDIWSLAEEYQDKRNDEGHAKTVLKYAIKLLSILPANEKIVIPAAILHDIGWSQLSKIDRMKIFQDDISSKERIELRIKHENEGVKLAKIILEQVNYDANLIEEILNIIEGHDTRTNFISKEDGIVRDADRLSIFSKWGVDSDLKIRKKINPQKYLDLIEDKLNKKYKFYFKESKQMALKELEDRRKEYSA
ncbi:MAG: HD domain-containing protein [Nanoarchaeota archaeon]|nr:HD domain-containing protein [Nanoarchaeota archaeon]